MNKLRLPSHEQAMNNGQAMNKSGTSQEQKHKVAYYAQLY